VKITGKFEKLMEEKGIMDHFVSELALTVAGSNTFRHFPGCGKLVRQPEGTNRKIAVRSVRYSRGATKFYH
jgi:hypothetical protein